LVFGVGVARRSELVVEMLRRVSGVIPGRGVLRLRSAVALLRSG
jgi:hypothetical protein